MLKQITLTAAALLFASGANAAVISGSSLQNELDSRSYDADGNSISFLDVNADQQMPDEVFTFGSTGGAISRLLFEFAGYAPNTSFGIYDVNDIDNKLEIFAGSNDANDLAVTLDISGTNFLTSWAYSDTTGTQTGSDSALFSSEAFGFYIHSNATNYFYSEQSQNADGIDHMATFEGGTGIFLDALNNGFDLGDEFLANEYLLAFEDLPGGGDFDYTDFVVLVESINPIPVPATLALFGLGLVGLGFSAKKKSK